MLALKLGACMAGTFVTFFIFRMASVAEAGHPERIYIASAVAVSKCLWGGDVRPDHGIVLPMIDDGDHALFERSRLAASAAQHHVGPRSWSPDVLCTLLQNCRVDCLYFCGNLMSEAGF